MCRTTCEVQCWYTGDKGELQRVEYTDGKIHHYKGEKNEEQLVRVEHPDGQVEHFKGEKGEERLRRVCNAKAIWGGWGCGGWRRRRKHASS